MLPLQVTTVVYRLHSNAPLGPQRNTLVRGVPATIYDEGRSIEIYTGRVAIDVFSDTLAHALAAAHRLLPHQRTRQRDGTAARAVYCPGPLRARSRARVAKVMASAAAADLPARRGPGSVRRAPRTA